MAHSCDRSKTWRRVIGTLESNLEPYFKIIGIFVSSNPEYAAIIWGGIRLVLQVGYR